MRKLNFLHVAWLILCMLAVSGAACAPVNPVAVAETPEQKAYAAYGMFVVFQETAADLVDDPALSDGVKLRIIEAEAQAHVVANGTLDAINEFLRVKAEFDAGESTEARVQIAANNLNDWITRLVPLVNELIRNIKGASN